MAKAKTGIVIVTLELDTDAPIKGRLDSSKVWQNMLDMGEGKPGYKRIATATVRQVSVNVAQPKGK